PPESTTAAGAQRKCSRWTSREGVKDGDRAPAQDTPMSAKTPASRAASCDGRGDGVRDESFRGMMRCAAITRRRAIITGLARSALIRHLGSAMVSDWIDRDAVAKRVAGIEFGRFEFDYSDYRYRLDGIPFTGVCVTRWPDGKLRGLTHMLNGLAHGI